MWPEQRAPDCPVVDLERAAAQPRRYEAVVGGLLEADPNNAFSGLTWPPDHWFGGHWGE
jgi:hypothetical protein